MMAAAAVAAPAACSRRGLPPSPPFPSRPEPRPAPPALPLPVLELRQQADRLGGDGEEHRTEREAVIAEDVLPCCMASPAELRVFSRLIVARAAKLRIVADAARASAEAHQTTAKVATRRNSVRRSG